MTAPSYTRPTLDVARERLETLIAAYREATGFPETVVGQISRNDKKFTASIRQRDFLHGSYDQVVARLSAVWPDGAEWPASVPRLAPADMDAETLQLIADRQGKARPRTAVEPLPRDAAWPADIPRPAGAAEPNGKANG